MSATEPEARLLVVEDEPNIRELLATSLQFAGFAVTTAADGHSAIKAATIEEPDLIVLDVMLPDMDGFAVTRKLREAGRRAPIVFVTARDSLDDGVSCERRMGVEAQQRGEQFVEVGATDGDPVLVVKLGLCVEAQLFDAGHSGGVMCGLRQVFFTSKGIPIR